jgi:hypothetical protein
MARTFTVDLLSLGESFERWCTAHNKTRSRAIRELVALALGQEEKGAFSLRPDTRPDTAPPASEPGMETRQERRFTLRLGEDDLKYLRKQSAAAGMPACRYLAALISTAEAGGAAIASEEALVALMQSNQQLAWIGRLLSDATRRGSPSVGNSVNLETDEIREAVGFLRKHLANAARVLAEVQSTRCRVQ